MLNQATLDMLTAMKMTAMAAEFANQLKDPTFNERTIASILKNGLNKPDKAESHPAQPKANSYGITRGAAYFRKGGDREC